MHDDDDDNGDDSDYFFGESSFEGPLNRYRILGIREPKRGSFLSGHLHKARIFEGTRLLRGSWDLVIRVINKVTTVIFNYNSN